MNYAHKLKQLSHNLSKSSKVNSYDTTDEKEADTIAHSLLDISESSEIINNKLIPKLKEGSINAEEIEDVLWEIGEELRHIIYHAKDPKFFHYLFNENDQEE